MDLYESTPGATVRGIAADLGWCGARYGSGSRRTGQAAGSAASTSTPPTSTSADTAGHLPGHRHRGRCLRPRTARDPRHARRGQRVDRLLDRVPPKSAPTLSQPHQSYQAPLVVCRPELGKEFQQGRDSPWPTRISTSSVPARSVWPQRCCWRPKTGASQSTRRGMSFLWPTRTVTRSG